MKFSVMIKILCVMACWSVTSAAMASQNFVYSFNDGTVSVSGTLTADPNGNGTFTAVAGTGSVTGGPNSGPLTFVTNPNAPNLKNYLGSHDYDDQLLPASNPLLSVGGLLFTFQNGDYLDIYSNGPSNYSVVEVTPTNTVSYRSGSTGTFTLASVPEPSSLVMLGIATACLAGFTRRGALRPRRAA